MTQLQCDVMNCANNKDNCCCKPNIQVNGPCACGSEQTCCSSFMDATNSAQNEVGSCLPNTSLEVSCDAKNCTFYTNEKCGADHISVSSGEENPDTASKTQCASFQKS
jgi:hypothetical protein